MNIISRQLLIIAANLNSQQIIEKQKQIFNQYGFNFNETEKGYTAIKTTKYFTYTFTIDSSRATVANQVLPNVSFKQTNETPAELVSLTRIGQIKNYIQLDKFKNEITDQDIKSQVEWFQALCEQLVNTNE